MVKYNKILKAGDVTVLRLITGRAGTGKTAAMINEIKNSMEHEDGRSLFIVPEQYSHEAERELCRVCGDGLSLKAEVLSFTGLARQLAAKHGGGAEPYLDKGGRLLCMALALQNIAPKLSFFASAGRKAELQDMLLSAVDELKSACVSYDALCFASESCGDSLGEKLKDLALIAEAYDAVVSRGHADPADRLSVLAAQIERYGLGDIKRVYVDGFIDFTGQELDILSAMLKSGAELTVGLTIDSMQGDNEIFELSRRAARRLLKEAGELGIELFLQEMSENGGRDKALQFFGENMFSYDSPGFDGDGAAIRLFRCESMAEECEQAAALCIELVRDGGCRWRDIAVTARGFEDYRGQLESVFNYYGVPLFTARRNELISKPLPAMIASAYDIIHGGWALDDVISYMRSGLTGLSLTDCDRLENYIFKWQLKGGAWYRKTPWHQHPEGFGGEYTDETEKQLEIINELRKALAAPLKGFAKSAAEAKTASEQARALSDFFQALKLPETLGKRAEELDGLGQAKAAAECRQLWELTVSAMEQFAAILGDSLMDSQEFSRLFLLMLSKYDIGTIPVSLDRVSAGDFDRNRRRNVKHMIVLGACDQRLPMSEESGGVFSEDERRRLLEMDIDLGGGGDSELWREFSLIYTCLTMPSESLYLLCPGIDSQGAEQRPAFVYSRARALFDIDEETAQLDIIRSNAISPAFDMAAQSFRQGSPMQNAAAEYFTEKDFTRFKTLEAAANMNRGRLSPAAVDRLYGNRLRLSASRIDKFASCRFAYFCQYGLKAKTYEPAGFTPPEYGSFMHYVLENTAVEVKKRGGFKKVEDNELSEICKGFIAQYVKRELNDFQEKSKRFEYLFKRLGADVWRVVQDMAAELRSSDFEPLDFELDFSKAEDICPPELSEDGGSLQLTGIADRVDGWYHEGKLYIRVVDYKTGRKEFSMSDIWYGMGLQMLLYLFALEDKGESRYGSQPISAGVMYVPARSRILSMSRDAEDEEISKERFKELRRSGLVLDDDKLIEAWERGEEKRYIPVKFKGGKASGDALAAAERLGVLKRHIKRELNEMAKQLRQGSISADPYYRSQQENACLNCDYASACMFADGKNGESCRFTPKLNAQTVWALMEESDDNG